MPCSIPELVISKRKAQDSGVHASLVHSDILQVSARKNTEQEVNEAFLYGFQLLEAAVLHSISCLHSFITNNHLFLKWLLQDLQFHTQISASMHCI